METPNETEIKEQEPTPRKVVLHFIRHGEAGYSGKNDAEGYLTDKGRQQAEEAAVKLYEELPNGMVVELVSSNRRRALETIETLGQKLKQLAEEGDKRILFHNEGVQTFSRFGMSDSETKEALDIQYGKKQNPIDHWLNNPGETPEAIQRNFQGALKHLANFAHHIITSGPDIHIIIGTHTGPAEVFLGQLLNKLQMPTLNNCEEFIIEIPQTGQNVKINFKDMSEEMKL